MIRGSLDSCADGLTGSESLGGESSVLHGEATSSDEESQPHLDDRGLRTILEGLNQYSGWRVYPEILARLMTAAVRLLRRGNEYVLPGSAAPWLAVLLLLSSACQSRLSCVTPAAGMHACICAHPHIWTHLPTCVALTIHEVTLCCSS